MVDKTTKMLLLVIAIGIWANLASNWTVVSAQNTSTIERYLRQIASGLCLNSKIC
jgi:hypothetical protein